jgi:Xaa-Pro dipeptidase
MDLARHFADHIKHVQDVYTRAMQALKEEAQAPDIDAVLVHSGTEGVYFGDDMHIPFRSSGHFNYWVPVIDTPDQMVLFQPGEKPIYFQVVPTDFWYEQGAETAAWWSEQFQVERLDDPAKVIDHLPAARRIAFLGGNTGFAAHIGLPAYLHNEKHLVNYLDYHRGMKTPYEVAQIKEANRLALISHRAAEQAFLDYGSEYDIHGAYLAANQMLEMDTPYTNIVGLDQKAAILHYQNKRRVSGKDSKVLLIDAGYRHNGYASDITRTYVRESAHPLFQSLTAKMDKVQLALVDKVHAGVPYIQIHEAAHEMVLDLLLEAGIVKGGRDEMIEKKVSSLFFPHGIGHLLGLQVHDVGGYFKDETGALAPPPEDHRFLRLNRPMTEGMVFTIEPGLYFIPVLLEPERNGEGKELGQYLDWSLIDELIPLGGIRFEDNILVTADGPENLTR